MATNDRPVLFTACLLDNCDDCAEWAPDPCDEADALICCCHCHTPRNLMMRHPPTP